MAQELDNSGSVCGSDYIPDARRRYHIIDDSASPRAPRQIDQGAFRIRQGFGIAWHDRITHAEEVGDPFAVGHEPSLDLSDCDTQTHERCWIGQDTSGERRRAIRVIEIYQHDPWRMRAAVL